MAAPPANHLLAIAASNGIGRRRVAEVLNMVGLASAAKRMDGFSRHPLGQHQPQGQGNLGPGAVQPGWSGDRATGVRRAGVLIISSEHTTGLIRTTFATLPRRRAVLGAKSGVAGAVTLAAGEVIAFATYWAGQQPLSAKHLNAALADPGVLRGVPAAGLYLAIITLAGLGLGAVIRHTAGATAALFALVFLIPQVIHAMPAPWATHRQIHARQRQAADDRIARAPGYLPPSASLIVCLAYAAAALSAAAMLITRRDA